MRILLSLLMVVVASAAQSAELRGVRFWDGDDSTRVVFDLNGSVRHRLFTLSAPDRVVLDISGLERKAAEHLLQRAAASGLVRRVRCGARSDGSTRVVLDLARPVHPRSFLLEPADGFGHRLVVDLTDPARAAAVPAAEPEAGAQIAAISAARSAKNPVLPRFEAKSIVVAVDAGHGGQDPGALGRSGLAEKDVALSISRRLVKLINSIPGYRGVLTRDGDDYVGLRERVERARRADADLFVSIHANAYKDRSLRGSAVYVLSSNGASSEHARWLAQKENAADMVGGLDLQDKDKELAAVLIDLSQASTMEASFDVGSRVLRSLGDIHRLQKKDVQQAGFMVLKAPDIPSILVETAFITNATDERLLADSAYQNKIARAVLQGVQGYFQRYRPQQQIAQHAASGGLVDVGLNATASAHAAPR